MDLWIRRWPKSWNHGQSDGSQIERPRAKQQFLLESRFCLVGQVNCCDRFGFGERTARPFLPPPVINLETILFRFRFKLSNELLHLSQQLWTEAGRGGASQRVVPLFPLRLSTAETTTASQLEFRNDLKKQVNFYKKKRIQRPCNLAGSWAKRHRVADRNSRHCGQPVSTN